MQADNSAEFAIAQRASRAGRAMSAAFTRVTHEHHLGLVLDAHRSANRIRVRLTLTSRACPLGELVLADVREKVAASYPEVTRVDIKLVWDPVWTPDLITDRGYELLGRPRTRTLT